ncbi:hypothetical protein DFQ27_007326 [Actinomortierella ambigua]|uniref:Uncharacterized protein n=1 Tax=Actinomortierella ambigua TaxID=1343610 RepID=A0A9P6PT91_9FUNG|nr:hypothetical protein DFQ27_007326 [Actinomortierella ambigua]
MERLLTAENLSRHTLHHKGLNVKRDFVQEYLDALPPWEPAPRASSVGRQAQGTSTKEQPSQPPTSKRCQSSPNHHANRNRKQQNNSSRPQQPLHSPVAGLQAEPGLPANNKRKTGDTKQSILDTNSTPISPEVPAPPKEGNSKNQRRKAAKRARQEEQKAKRRRKQAPAQESELDTVAQEIQQLDVGQSNTTSRDPPSRPQVVPSSGGPITRSRSSRRGSKNQKTPNAAATAATAAPQPVGTRTKTRDKK